jgi:hypothetical protein
VPHGVELSCPQQFCGLVIKENQVTLNILLGTDRSIVLNLNMSFILFDIRKGISTFLIDVLQVYKEFFKIECVK